MSEDRRLLNITIEALKLACHFLRSNPPGNLDLYPQDMIIKALAGGDEDPNGDRYMTYFLEQAIKNIDKEREEK